MIKTQQTLKVFGTLLFLYGVFGYIFPKWGMTFFSNNENLLHVVTGIIAIIYATGSSIVRRNLTFLFLIIYLGLGIYGVALNNPTSIHFKQLNVPMQFNDIDNYIHIAIALIIGWIWILTINKKKRT